MPLRYFVFRIFRLFAWRYGAAKRRNNGKNDTRNKTSVFSRFFVADLFVISPVVISPFRFFFFRMAFFVF